MASNQMDGKANTFKSNIGGITLTGRAHSLSAWFVLALRLMIGYAFLYAGWTKLPFVAGEAFDAQGYLVGAVPQTSPLAGLFASMGQIPWFVDFVNVAVPWGEVLIGLGVLVGLLTRLAAFWGAFMMLLFYFGNWEIEHGLINGDFAYMLVFLAVAAFGAGRILGLDAIVERYEIDGKPLIERYPKLDYILG